MNGDARTTFARLALAGGLSSTGLAVLAKLAKAYGSRTAALDAVERYGAPGAALAAAGALDPAVQGATAGARGRFTHP